MSKTAIISEVFATGEELNEVISRVEPILVDYTGPLVVMACLEIAAHLMNPFASAEDLQEVVRSTSQFMCLALDGKGDMEVIGSPSKEVMN